MFGCNALCIRFINSEAAPPQYNLFALNNGLGTFVPSFYEELSTEATAG